MASIMRSTASRSGCPRMPAIPHISSLDSRRNRRESLPREPLLTKPDLERQQDEHSLIQPAPAERADAPTFTGVAEPLHPELHDTRIEKRADARAARKQEFGEHVVERRPDHPIQRNREALLSVRRDPRGQPAPGERPKDQFALAAVCLQSVRESAAAPG